VITVSRLRPARGGRAPRPGDAARSGRSPVWALRLVLLVVAITVVSPPASAGAYVYWANYNPGHGTALGRANLDGTGANQSFIAAATDSIGLAVDGQHVYWTNALAGTIGRANLDGTGVNQLFITGLGLALGVAVDGQHIYWTDEGPSESIGRANLDGSSPNNNFITGARNPGAVVVDGQHIYWTNPSANTIGRANLDGTSVDQSFITLAGAAGPSGVAVDGKHVYWTTERPGFVARANLDGSGAEPSFIPTGDAVPAGLAVDAQHVYWANEAVGTIGRANLDGSMPAPSFIAGRFNVAAVAVDSLAYPSATSVACSPAALTLPASTSCTATVTDTVALGAPTGTVAFSSTGPGSFGSPASCALLARGGAQSACQLSFTPSLAGAQTITATYLGNVMHATSSAASLFTAVAPTSTVIKPSAKPSNLFVLSRPKLNRRHGSAVLVATVPGAGMLLLTGRGIRQLTRSVSHADTVKLRIKGQPGTRRRLSRTGKAPVTVKVTYTPTGGDPNTESKKLTLRRGRR
jgi:virginiamycin B lyase